MKFISSILHFLQFFFRYAVSRAVQPEVAFLRYWEEVQGLLAVRALSTFLDVFFSLKMPKKCYLSKKLNFFFSFCFFYDY